MSRSTATKSLPDIAFTEKTCYLGYYNMIYFNPVLSKRLQNLRLIYLIKEYYGC